MGGGMANHRCTIDLYKLDLLRKNRKFPSQPPPTLELAVHQIDAKTRVKGGSKRSENTCKYQALTF
jgi:hypothetical protein